MCRAPGLGCRAQSRDLGVQGDSQIRKRLWGGTMTNEKTKEEEKTAPNMYLPTGEQSEKETDQSQKERGQSHIEKDQS